MADGDRSLHGDRTTPSRRTVLRAVGGSGVALGAAGLAGCLGTGSSEGRLILSSNADFADNQQPIQEALWEAGLDESITVEIRAGDMNTENRRQEYDSALSAGRSDPDMFMMDSGWTLTFILRDQVLNMSAALPEDVLDRVESDYLDAALETARHPESGDLYGIPLYPDFGLVHYRRDLLEEAGYDPDGQGWPTDPPSWQEFAQAVADTLERNPDIDYGFTTQAASYSGLACCSFNEMMSSWGGAYFGGTDDLFGPVGDRPVTVNDGAVLDAIGMMRSFLYGPDDEYGLDGFPRIAPTACLQWTEEDARAPFTNGNAIAHRNWPYALVVTAEEEFGDELGSMPIPTGISPEQARYEGTGGSTSALGGFHLAINPNTERMDAALQVAEAFTHDNVMLTIFGEVGNIPPVLDLLDGVGEEDVGPIGRYTDAIQAAGENAVPRPVTDIWPYQSSVIHQQVHDAFTGVSTPPNAMAELQSRLEWSERRAR